MICASPTLAVFVEAVYLPAHFVGERFAGQLRRIARRFEEWAGMMPISEITEELLTGFLRSLLNSGMEGRTVNNRRQELLTILRFAWRKRRVHDFPRDVPRAPEIRRSPTAWTVDEVSRLLAVSARAPGLVGDCLACDWWPALVLTLYWSGARVGDAMAAKPGDVDMGRGLWLCRTNKTGKEHVYDLPPQCVSALAKIHDARRDRLFPWPFGSDHLYVSFRRLVRAAGIRYSGRPCQMFYRLRRTNLSYCWAADPGIAVRQADHSSAEITRLHYVDPSIVHARTAADVLPVPSF